jgi:transcription elongation GreA/GreB family factor
LEDKLARAEIVDVSKLSGDVVKFGATVTLVDKDTGEKRIWQIVGEPEADAKKTIPCGGTNLLGIPDPRRFRAMPSR